jgi:hypothetical protein
MRLGMIGERMGYIVEKDTFYSFWSDESEQTLQVRKMKIQ